MDAGRRRGYGRRNGDGVKSSEKRFAGEIDYSHRFLTTLSHLFMPTSQSGKVNPTERGGRQNASLTRW